MLAFAYSTARVARCFILTPAASCSPFACDVSKKWWSIWTPKSARQLERSPNVCFDLYCPAQPSVNSWTLSTVKCCSPRYVKIWFCGCNPENYHLTGQRCVHWWCKAHPLYFAFRPYGDLSGGRELWHEWKLCLDRNIAIEFHLVIDMCSFQKSHEHT